MTEEAFHKNGEAYTEEFKDAHRDQVSSLLKAQCAAAIQDKKNTTYFLIPLMALGITIFLVIAMILAIFLLGDFMKMIWDWVSRRNRIKTPC